MPTSDQQYRASKFVVVDLDRTLFRSDDFFHDSLRALIMSGVVDRSSAEELARDVEASRGTDTDWITMIAIMSGHSMNDIIQIVYRKLTEKNSAVYFYEGAIALLKWLNESATPYIVMTKGGRTTQELKLAILRHTVSHNVPSLITDTASKAEWIADRMRMADERVLLPELFNYPDLTVEKVYIIDDKVQHLHSNSKVIVGIHINNSSKPADHAIRIAEARQLLDSN